MDIPKYTLAFAITALLSTHYFIPLAWANDIHLPALQIAYEQNPANEQAAYDYALALARNEQFPLSLNLFKQLSASSTNPNILFDYATVLAWSGDNRGAISLYEDQILHLERVPLYVKKNIAGAYYKLAKFKEAYLLYHEVGAAGNRQARRWEAEALMHINDFALGNKIYDQLIFEDPTDIETYVSRGSMLILAGDPVTAAIDVTRALQLIPAGQEGNPERQLRNEMSIAFIQHGDYSRGILLLQPTITDGSASMKMQSNYIYALRLNNDYKLAIQEATKLWTDLSLVPDFGLQALADSYLRSAQPQKAISIYNVILQRGNEGTNLKSVKLSLAYAYVKSGNRSKGLSLYDEILSAHPDLAYIVAEDAASFIESNEFFTGKMLYKKLIAVFPNDVLYRKQFAYALSEKYMPRESYEQYKALSTLKDGNLVGLSGIVSTALAVGDYKTADTALDSLEESYSYSPITDQASKRYEARPKGSIEYNYQVESDYKNNNTIIAELTAKLHIRGRFSLLAGANRNIMNNGVNSATLQTNSFGLKYQDTRQDATLWLDNYRFTNLFTGYRFFANHYFNDNSVVGLKVERAPIKDLKSLLLPIMSTNYQVSFHRQLGLKDQYNVAFASSNYSDSNVSKTYGVNLEHTMFSNEKKTLTWFTSFDRINYKYQEIKGQPLTYEPPTVREAYVIGFKERWTLEKNSWNANFRAVWDRDRPEAFAFSPSVGVEFNHQFSPNKVLVAGLEYGFHNTLPTSINTLGIGYKQSYLYYRVNW